MQLLTYIGGLYRVVDSNDAMIPVNLWTGQARKCKEVVSSKQKDLEKTAQQEVIVEFIFYGLSLYSDEL